MVPSSRRAPAPSATRSPLALAALLACAAPPAASQVVAAAPEECLQGRVTVIFIDNYPVFDLARLEDSSLLWAYELANDVHFLTSPDFIRQELLFEEGDCYNPLLLEESARILREYRHLSDVDVFPVQPTDPGPGDEVHVTVQTSDEWTTRASFNVRIGGGFDFRGASIREENLLGQGVTLGGHYANHEDRDAWGVEFHTPQLGPSRWDALLAGGQTRVGNYFTQGLLYPFVGEVGRVGAREVFRFREDYFYYAAGEGSEYRTVLVPFQEESTEITLAARLGDPGNLTRFGIGFSREKIEFPDVPSGVRVGDEHGLGTRPADVAVLAEIRDQVRPRTRGRVHFLVGQRNVRWVQRRGMDALFGAQDVRVGTDFTLTMGRSMDLPDVAGGEVGDDLFGRVQLFAGTAPASFVLGMEGSIESLRTFSDEDGEADWVDVLGSLDLYGYWLREDFSGHTIFFRVSGAGGWRSGVPFQLTLGGERNVRGFRDERFPGGRRVVATLEDRIAFRWPFPELFDFGITTFVDAGRMWEGDAPFGADSEYHASAGFGIRIGSPPGSRRVIRADMAFPLTGDERFGGAVFRLSLEEVVGLLAGFQDPQLQRSRRVGVGTELFLTSAR